MGVFVSLGKRVAQFATPGNRPPVPLKSIDKSQLTDETSLALNPPGTILEWGGPTAPSGYLLCTGASLLRTDYPELFSAIGTNHGAADGTHFNIPDHRGRATRMVDGGVGRDPDRAARTAANTGGSTGDNVGSVQSDQFISHTHTEARGGSSPAYTSLAAATNDPGTGILGTTNASGGNETRMKNANVNKIIKY